MTPALLPGARMRLPALALPACDPLVPARILPPAPVQSRPPLGDVLLHGH